MHINCIQYINIVYIYIYMRMYVLTYYGTTIPLIWG